MKTLVMTFAMVIAGTAFAGTTPATTTPAAPAAPAAAAAPATAPVAKAEGKHHHKKGKVSASADKAATTEKK